MTCGYQNSAGTDLDNLFYINNGNAGALGFQVSNGQDLGNRYTNGSTLGYSVGYQNSAGTDLGYLRGNFNPATQLGIYKPSGYPWDVGIGLSTYGVNTEVCDSYCSDSEGGSYCCRSHWSQYVVNADQWVNWWNSNGAGACVKVNGRTNDAIFRNIHSSYNRSVCIFAYSPNSNYPVTDITCTRECFGYYHNSWSEIPTGVITVNNLCKGLVIAPTTGAGGGVYAVFTITATFANYGNMVYKVAIGAYVDSNKPVWGAADNIVSYDCGGVNYYHQG